VLSGVLERQAQEVAAVYATWLPMTVWQARDGWVCLAGRKP
jgi:ribosomal protein L11 methyltransferase